MLEKLHFVTSSKDKLREAREILGIDIVGKNVDLIEPQSLDLEEIVRFKVEQAYELVRQPVIVDDVGLFLDAWEGRPGPFIKFFLPNHKPDLILKMLGKELNRKVTAVCAIGFHNGQNIQVVLGEITGVISGEISGDNGFGWDPLVIPDGYNQTFAQMGPELKNQISHRHKALTKLRPLL